MTTAIESLRSIDRATLNEAAAAYLRGNVELQPPYETKSQTSLARIDVVDVAWARVYLEGDTALVVARTGKRNFYALNSPLDHCVALAFSFEGANLQAFAASIQAALRSAKPGEPLLVINNFDKA